MGKFLAVIPLAIAVALGGFFLWGLKPDRDPNGIPSVLIGQKAPAFELAPPEGAGVPGLATADLTTTGDVSIINVFASWCVPCRAEHAVLTRMVEQDGIRLLGINYKDKPEDAVAWLNNLGNPYERIGSDISGRAGVEWGISGVPETFIVGGDGTVLYRYVGPIVGDTAVATFKQALADARANTGVPEK